MLKSVAINLFLMLSNLSEVDYSLRTEELKKSILPMIRLAGDRVPGDSKFMGALYGLNGHFLNLYKFDSINLFGPHDSELVRDINFLAGLIKLDIPRFYGEGDSRDVYYDLTSMGVRKADSYLYELEESNRPGLEILKHVSKILRNSKWDKSALNVYKSVDLMNRMHSNIEEESLPVKDYFVYT